MAHESLETIADATHPQTRRAMVAGRDVAERAGAYVQHQVARLAEGAQDLARLANDRLKESTGRPLEAWTADTRDFVRTHPIQMLAATVGLGYVLGKILKR